MAIHNESHPLAGQTVTVNFSGQTFKFQLEDWWDKLTGSSWRVSKGNPACLNYTIRVTMNDLPINDRVVYGKIDGVGYLVHVSEIVSDKND